MKFIIDMNLSPQWCETLQRAGHQATHWMTIGPNDATDETIMDWACEHECVVLTHDLDFGSILATAGSTSPSVIQLRALDVLPEAMGNVVTKAIEQFQSQIEKGALLSIDHHKMRIRILPLGQPDTSTDQP